MKKIMLIVILLLTNSVNAIVINQVLYDPIKTESGGEAIELFNEQNREINIENWYIKTEKAEKDFIFPEGTILFPQQTFLLADKEWNTSKDNSDWKEADSESEITLYNKNSGVALFDNKNRLVDAVGWGNITDSDLYKGSPAKQVKEGNALVRTTFSGDNQKDFTEKTPDFSAKEVDFIIEIKNEENIRNIEILDEDETKEGIQISNSASKNISLKLTFFSNYVEDAQINFLNKIIVCKIKSSECKSEIEIKKELEAKKYIIEIKAGKQIEYKEIEILERKGFKLDKYKLNISAKKGEEFIEKIKIKNTGNINQEIKIQTTEQFADIIYFSHDEKEFSTINQNVINIPFNSEKIIYFKIKIAPNAKEGIYRGKIVFKAK